uniref:Uncharacterized protein n=1 Tax=Timema poppense TaxID=170557 RepID=A0A7R9CJE8_TIMPO|nr:unnamed protein product [Timema poppensis]
MTGIKHVLGILEPIVSPCRREVGLHLLIADDNAPPHCAQVSMPCPERNDIVLISLDTTIVSEETITTQVQQQILTIINNDYQSNTQQYIEDNIFEFAEFVYADIDVTNYFRYYLDDITIIDIKNYANDFLKDRQSLLLEQNIEVMSLDDIHTNIDTVSNGSFELAITNRTLGDFTSMQQLGNALYSYNESAEYFNLNTYITYVFPELLCIWVGAASVSHSFLSRPGVLVVSDSIESVAGSTAGVVLVMGEDTEVVSGDGVPQEVREQIETVIKETYLYKDWDAIDTYISIPDEVKRKTKKGVAKGTRSESLSHSRTPGLELSSTW